MTEKILTKQPLGKSGKNIDKQNYETLKEAILSALRNKELTHTELLRSKILTRKLKTELRCHQTYHAESF